MRIEAAHPEEYGWLVERTGCAITSDFNAIKAVSPNGLLRGMVGYGCWTLNSVQLHMAVQSPIVWRHLLDPALSYPFIERGLGICLGIIPAGNTPSCRMARAAGFRDIGRVKDGWSQGEDLVLFQLLKEEWERGRRAPSEGIRRGKSGESPHGSRARAAIAHERRVS